MKPHRSVPAFVLSLLLAISAHSVTAQTPPPTKYVAIITGNVNVDGTSYQKGVQAEALGYDKVSGKITISDKGTTAKIPANFVRVVPEAQAGITVVHAEYTMAGQPARNVTAPLQRKFDGQQKVSFVVSGAAFGVRSQPSAQMPAPNGNGPTRQNTKTGGMSPQSQLQSLPMQASGTLSVEYYFKGTASTVSAPDGQTIALP